MACVGRTLLGDFLEALGALLLPQRHAFGLLDGLPGPFCRRPCSSGGLHHRACTSWHGCGKSTCTGLGPVIGCGGKTSSKCREDAGNNPQPRMPHLLTSRRRRQSISIRFSLQFWFLAVSSSPTSHGANAPNKQVGCAACRCFFPVDFLPFAHTTAGACTRAGPARCGRHSHCRSLLIYALITRRRRRKTIRMLPARVFALCRSSGEELLREANCAAVP